MKSFRIAGGGVFLALALALSPSMAQSHLATVATATEPDPAAMWSQFLATSDNAKVVVAFDVLEAVGYDGITVDAVACTQQRDALVAALATVPVSISLQRAAYLCADALGDDAGVETALEKLAALSRHALLQAGDPDTGRPIRVLGPVDAHAMIVTAGMDVLYQYYSQMRAGRYFPLVTAAWDAESKTERHFVSDAIDTRHAISRDNPYFRFPVLRTAFAEETVRIGASAGFVAARDIATVNMAALEDGVEAKLAVLHATASLGGIRSLQAWLALCAEHPEADCESLIDALLPLAEKQLALPMTLLAYAHVAGIGVPRDETSGWALLDAADRRWNQRGGTAHFAAWWNELHPDEVLPDELQRRLALAASAGNRYPQRLAIRTKLAAEQPLLTPDEEAFLVAPTENGTGQGHRLLARYYEAIKEPGKARAAMIDAAAAGNADAQGFRSSALAYANEEPKDLAAAERLAIQAAHGGDPWAAAYLAGLSERAEQFGDAENWLLAAASAGNIKAIIGLATLYEAEHAGVSGTLDRALEIYRSLADEKGWQGAEARRRLADMALEGRGMDKDPRQAQLWLLADATDGDHESEVLLGIGYLQGDFGKPDERQGLRWITRALDANDEDAHLEYGSWLYYTKNTPASRESALATWAKGDAAGHISSTNNRAWVLCTSSDPEIRDAVLGAEVAVRLGEPETMAPGYLDTLAACYAANGDFQRAVELQTSASAQMSELDPPEAGAEIPGHQRRLALYRAKQPFVETEQAE